MSTNTKNRRAVKSMNPKQKKKRWLSLLLLVLLFAAAGGGVWHFFIKPDKVREATVVTGDFLPGQKDASKMSDKEIADYAQKAVDSSKFQMIIGSTITVNSKDSSSDLYIQNPPTNAFPIDVTIRLKDGTIVYDSGAIQTGYEVKNATLKVPLDKGSYTGTALFKLYDTETSKAKGQVAAAVTFVVN